MDSTNSYSKLYTESERNFIIENEDNTIPFGCSGFNIYSITPGTLPIIGYHYDKNLVYTYLCKHENNSCQPDSDIAYAVLKLFASDRITPSEWFNLYPVPTTPEYDGKPSFSSVLKHCHGFEFNYKDMWKILENQSSNIQNPYNQTTTAHLTVPCNHDWRCNAKPNHLYALCMAHLNKWLDIFDIQEECEQGMSDTDYCGLSGFLLHGWKEAFQKPWLHCAKSWKNLAKGDKGNFLHRDICCVSPNIFWWADTLSYRISKPSYKNVEKFRRQIDKEYQPKSSGEDSEIECMNVSDTSECESDECF